MTETKASALGVGAAHPSLPANELRLYRKERQMSRYMINKAADERGVSHGTAMLIWESCESIDEFLAALDDYAEGRGFTLAY